MKVTFFSTQPYDRRYFQENNAAFGHDLYFLEPALNSETAILAKDAGAVCVFVNDKLDHEVLKRISDQGVELIALRCAGFNQVDIAAAYELGMKVARVPAYSPHAVAEHAVALIMTLNRKTHKAYNRVREYNFSLDRLEGFDMYGKTVGVIGTGKIGQVFCRIMKGFGCKVIAYDTYPNTELAESGVTYVPLNELFALSDIVSLHCPLTPDTHHIIDEAAISRMKKGVMLINTSRGALVDSRAVNHGLKSSQIGYLGLDVYEQEEALFFKDLSETVLQDERIGKLMSFPNVLITAHQAFFTNHALEQIARITLQNVSDFESGKLDDSREVTPAMLK